MTTKKLERIKKELYELKEDNYSKIRQYDEKVRMTKVNQKDNQIGNTLALSIMPYFATIFVLMFMDGNIDLSFLTNVIPPFTIPIILMGGSLGIGAIANKLINKKYKTKERFKTFSKSKTEIEKIEEEITNQIELEKLNNRNKVIDDVIENLEDNVLILSKINSRYDTVDRKLSQTEEETIDSINKISKLLEEKYNELDILTTKKVLSENFWRLRLKYQKGMDLTMVTAGTGVLTMMLTTLPFIITNNIFASCSMIQKEIILFSSLSGGTIIPGTYWIKRNKNRQEAFNNLNNKLGENALPEKEKSTYDERKELELLIERQIREITVVKTQLIEQKEVLERISSQNGSKDNSKGLKNNNEKTWNDILISEEEIKLYMQESPAPFNPETIFGMNEEEQDESLEKKSGKKLVRKPKSSDTNNKQ